MYEVLEIERDTTWSDGSPVIIGREKCGSLHEAVVLCKARKVEQDITGYDGSYFEVWEDGNSLDEPYEPADDDGVVEFLHEWGYEERDIFLAMGEAAPEEE